MELRSRNTPSLRRSVALLASAAAIVVVHSSLAVAQSAQPYAFQIAGFSTAVAVGHEAVVTTGYGVEPQLRMNRLYSGERFGALSLGVGGQWTSHTEASDKMKIIGAFLEPRWVPALGTTHIFPYLSARVAFLRQSSNFGTASTGEAVGGGGGLGIKLTNTMNLDAGAQFISQKFGLFNFSDDGSLGPSTSLSTFAAKVGFSWGFPGH